MKRILFFLLLFALIATALLPNSASAAGPKYVTVQWGDTLFSIAARNGTTVSALMSANGLADPNFVYAGQRLLIPTGNVPGPSNPPSTGPTYYTVRAGDTLYGIAARYGVSASAIAQANNIWNYDFVWTGQVLRIPGTGNVQPPQPPSGNKPPAGGNVSGRWIEVNIGAQSITAWDGDKALKTVKVSTGVAAHPTVVGKFKVYAKYPAYTMSGGTRGVDYYYLPNVPWTMFFYSGYAIHGTYWHNNFGHPMSHGCVNLTIADAKWFYDFAVVGTTVVTH